MENIEWLVSPFDELSSRQVYDIMKLRQDVFIIEQDCIYEDLDGYDELAIHLCGYSQNKLLCYARFFRPGIKYAEASIGRIVVSPKMRGAGLGKVLVSKANAYCEQEFKTEAIRIEAQSHLQNFYTELGYTSVGEIYPVDGIDHIQMVRKKSGA
jgi:ElaA protein